MCQREKTQGGHSCDLSPASPAPLVYFFFQLAYFFHRERERDHSEHAMSCHPKKIDRPNKSNKYTNQSNKYAISTKRERQPKHQVRHLNQKNMPTKIPSTPSQSKEYANQNTKYAISIKRIRQPKHQIRCLNQKNTPMWILVLNIDLRSFVVRQLLSRIYALFGVQFEVLKIALAYKKWQITGMVLGRLQCRGHCLHPPSSRILGSLASRGHCWDQQAG